VAKRWLCGLAAAAMLGGCANMAPPVRTGVNRVSRPATLSERFDGSYQGRAVLLATSGPGCPVRPHYGVVEIGDAELTFPYLPDLILSAPVAPDGSLHAKAGPAVLYGRIVNDRLEFTIRTPTCLSHYSMHYVWNHS
jgi:hypothetical protein